MGQTTSRMMFNSGYLIPSRGATSSVHNPTSNTGSLFGVGMYYQLYEMQQVYRHPRKIYELALTMNGSTKTTENPITKTTITPKTSATSTITPPTK